MPENTAIVWFRKDLRLQDNPALHHAAMEGLNILPVYIHDPEAESPWPIGSASSAWLHHSLLALQKALSKLNSQLLIIRGDTLSTLRQLRQETGATHLFWNRRYEPSVIARDACVKQQLQSEGLHIRSFNSCLLAEPWEIENQQGKPFQVFTPFWKHHRQHILPTAPLPEPPADSFIPAGSMSQSMDVASLGLKPPICWDVGFWEHFTPGENGAHEALHQFIQNQAISNYQLGRNLPGQSGTSRLSPHLHFGEISPRQVHHQLHKNRLLEDTGATTFLREIGWREFAYHLLYHFPHTTEHPLKDRFAHFPWEPDSSRIEAWKRGRTGIPIIDAGMRELWQTGWMHNRVRMIAGSYLVKNLLTPWQTGAEWFWDTLVDADLASNTLGWQWVAGCGADAAPYFRIFNPILQSEKFDPSGTYIRRWVPELRSVQGPIIHTPWRDASLLSRTGYPDKTISLIESRNRALSAYETISA